MYNRFWAEPFTFNGIVQLTGKMDEIFFTKRTFDKNKTKKETTPRKGIVYMTQQKIEPSAQRVKGTFLISVQFRQNATWQGTIVWAERDSKKRFRSALEMIKLMDEAMMETADEEEKITWDEKNVPE